MFTPSKYQQAIFEHVERGQGNAVVDDLDADTLARALTTRAEALRAALATAGAAP